MSDRGHVYSCFLKVMISEGKLVLSSSQTGAGNERVQVSVKKQKKYFEFVKTDLEVIDFQA